MASTAKVNPAGGSVSWSLGVSNLKLGVYRVRIIDNAGNVLEQWDDMRTDKVAGSITLATPPASLPGCILWWEASVSDPTDAGGAYVCTVNAYQGGASIGSDLVQDKVGAGSGQLSPIGDQITFM